MKNISIEELLKKYSKDALVAGEGINIIDVREVDEYQQEHIACAKNVPFAQINTLDAEDCAGKVGLFHCRSGRRTDINAALLDSTPFEEMYCLEGGIVAWKEAGLPIKNLTSAPIDVMRQVQFIISMMILFGVGLSYLISPYFILLAVFAGVGLLVASVTGFCGMASMLKFLPWNKVKPHGVK
jgi:rhodanese-related sulfurtransferase